MKHLLQVSFFCLCSLLGYGQATSNFNINDEGWTIFNTSSGASTAAVYSAGGGNPGGYISDPGTTSGPTIFYAEAPSKFKGNFSYAYNQNLSFDLKQSTAGTDNTNGDLMIQSISTGVTLYYQLPVKPAVATFTSYSVQLSESFAGWHVGSPAGAAPTKSQMKVALSDITTIRIRLKYTTSNTFSVTGSLDNVVLNMASAPTPPVITSFSPDSGLPGSTVTINGNNFNPTASQNKVFFNGIKAAIVSASATQIKVTSPARIAYGPITVLNLSNGTQGTSGRNFNPLFDNNKDFGGRIIPSTFAGKIDFGSTTEVGFSIGDLDGDGWTDAITSGDATKKVSVFRNANQAGVVNSSSFSAPVVLNIPNSPVAGAVARVGQNSIADMDGDGKPDLVINVGYNYGNYNNGMAIFLNQSTPGNLSFSTGTVFEFSTINNNNEGMSILDVDGDGRPDFLGALGNSACALGIAQNLSTPGNLDFTNVLNYSQGATMGTNISYGDLTGDGKPEILIEAYLGGSISVYENLSIPGTVSLASPFQISTVTTTNIQVADLDGDGKAEVFFKNTGGPLQIKKNNHTAGPLAAADFSPDIVLNSFYPSGGSTSAYVGSCDVNGDNLVDIISNDGTNVVVYQNIYTSGILSANSFNPGISFEGFNGFNAFVFSADIDGDNKPEILVKPQVNANISVYRNESFPPPQISSVSPSNAYAGSAMTLNGNYFNTYNDAPQIKASGSLRIGTSLSNTSVNIIAPLGASDTRAVVTLHGLSGFSKGFTPAFPGNQTINATSFLAGVNLALSNNGAQGLTIADFDDDSKPDIIADDNQTGRIFQNALAAPGDNITAGTFSLLAGTIANSIRLTSGDFDGDGKTDVVTGSNLLYRNNSTTQPSFAASVSTNLNSATALLANHDFNGDGKQELASTAGSTIYVYENLTRKGVFTPAPFPSFAGNGSIPAMTLSFSGIGSGLNAADYDGDGYEDIAIGITNTTSTLTLFRNTGLNRPITSSQFAAPVNFVSLSSPSQIISADFDGDGKTDLAMGYSAGSNISIFQNQSTPGTITFGTRQDLVAPSGFTGMDARDLDGDNKAEIVIANYTGGIGSFSVYKNTSAGSVSFAAPISFNVGASKIPSNLSIADLNLDSRPDIIIRGTGSTNNFLTIFQNNVPLVSLTITTQPSDALVCLGQTGNFTTAASGTTNITYQWQYSPDGIAPFTDIANGGGYSNTTTTTLSVNTTGNFGSGRYRCKINGDFAAAVYTLDEGLFINAVPSAPLTTGASGCQPASIVLNATGAINGQYRWYTVPTGGAPITGETNSSYTTSVLTTTTSYYVSINNGSCESTRTLAAATINIPPAKPLVISSITPSAGVVSICSGGSVTLTAPPGFNLYAWSSGATTQQITASSPDNYSVVVTDAAGCSSPSSDILTLVVLGGPCQNQPPVVTAAEVTVPIAGNVSLDLAALISDPDNNLDIGSLKIKSLPVSGAPASITTNAVLLIDYSGISFSGTDRLTIEVCDLSGACSQQELKIEVVGEIIVNTGISPDGNGQNDKWIIQYIEALPDTKDNHVLVFNRWGDAVYETSNYDNVNRVFTGQNKNGNDLPTGTYFYKIEFASGKKTMTGYLSLKR